MKRALLIGIDSYDSAVYAPLSGCVNDVQALAPLLSRHDDGTPNFNCRVFRSDRDRIDRRACRQAMDELLAPGADIALLYFAGHGEAVNSDVVLVTQDGVTTDAGVALSDF